MRVISPPHGQVSNARLVMGAVQRTGDHILASCVSMIKNPTLSRVKVGPGQERCISILLPC